MTAKPIIFLYILLSCLYCQAQYHHKCTVYQHDGLDTTKKHVALVQLFNEKGKVISKTYSQYMENSNVFTGDGTYLYLYNDTLLAEVLCIEGPKDTSSRSLYFYDSCHRLIRLEYYHCERKLRNGLRKGFGQPGGCIVYAEDFDTTKTWTKSDETTFEYDNLGRRIGKHGGHDYDRAWEYDSLNRISEERCYSGGRLKCKEEYHYHNGYYQYARVYYDEFGNPELPDYRNGVFNPIFHFSFYTNDSGQLTRQTLTTETGMEIWYELYEYDEKGRYKKITNRYTDKHYIRDGVSPEIVHIYEYE